MSGVLLNSLYTDEETKIYEVMSVASGHTVSVCQSQDLKQGCVAPEPTFLPLTVHCNSHTPSPMDRHWSSFSTITNISVMNIFV